MISMAGLEIKVTSINLLSEMKDKLVKKITLQIPIMDLNKQMVSELSALIKNNSGDSLLYFKIIGETSRMNIDLFSRATKIGVNRNVINYLKDVLSIDFSIN